MKIRRVGAEVFNAGGWTDGHDEANSRFSQFCGNAPKNQTGIRQASPLLTELHL